MDIYNDFASPYMDGMQMGTVEGLVAKAGEDLPEDITHANQDALITALSSVFDPEIPVNIYELGLIYDCSMDDKGDVIISMTLTTPNCPVAGELPVQVAEAVANVAGVGNVSVTLTFDPPWRPELMSEDAKMALDLF